MSNKAVWTLKIQKERGSKEFFEIGLRELDEPTWIAAESFIQQKKERDAIKVIIANCWVSGEPKETILGNFQYIRSAMASMWQFIEPLESELKKN